MTKQKVHTKRPFPSGGRGTALAVDEVSLNAKLTPHPSALRLPPSPTGEGFLLPVCFYKNANSVATFAMLVTLREKDYSRLLSLIKSVLAKKRGRGVFTTLRPFSVEMISFDLWDQIRESNTKSSRTRHSSILSRVLRFQDKRQAHRA